MDPQWGGGHFVLFPPKGNFFQLQMCHAEQQSWTEAGARWPNTGSSTCTPFPLFFVGGDVSSRLGCNADSYDVDDR